jgi:hypothetical protein
MASAVLTIPNEEKHRKTSLDLSQTTTLFAPSPRKENARVAHRKDLPMNCQVTVRAHNRCCGQTGRGEELKINA